MRVLLEADETGLSGVRGNAGKGVLRYGCSMAREESGARVKGAVRWGWLLRNVPPREPLRAAASRRASPHACVIRTVCRRSPLSCAGGALAGVGRGDTGLKPC